MRWIILHLGVVFACGFAFCACEPESETLPSEMLQTWHSDAPRYRGRSFELRDNWVIYGIGGARSNLHPMEHVARQEERIGDTIFLEIHAQVLHWDGVLFAPDVANKSGVPTYTMDEAADIIDYEVLYTRTDWNDAAIQDRLQQAEKSEILVPNQIPLAVIRNVPNG